MKKLLCIVLLTILMVGCQSQANKQSYQAVLAGPIDIKSDGAISIHVVDVEALTKNDDSIQTDKSGLVLNVQPDVIDDIDYARSLNKGAKLMFEIKTPTITTRSIPPQIAGDSIISVGFFK